MGKQSYQERAFGYCDHCGKFLFSTKKEAKKAAKSALPHIHPSTYPCPVNDGWHWGKLSPRIIKGKITRRKFYRRDRNESSG